MNQSQRINLQRNCLPLSWTQLIVSVKQRKQKGIDLISFFSWIIASGMVEAAYDRAEVEVIKFDLFHGFK